MTSSFSYTGSFIVSSDCSKVEEGGLARLSYFDSIISLLTFDV